MEATKRPRSTDTEEDLIEMQEEYFKQKEGDPNLKPAAVAIRPESSGQKQSLFSIKRNIKQSPKSDKDQSKVGVLGQVVERKYDSSQTMEIDKEAEVSPSDEGFPKPQPIDARCGEGSKDKSLFSQLKKSSPQKAAETEPEPESSKETNESSSMEPSVPTEERGIGTMEMEGIHEENQKKLDEMTSEQIEAAKAAIKATFDQRTIDFLMGRTSSARSTIPIDSLPMPSSPKKSKTEPEDLKLPLASEFLTEAASNNYMHFDVLEPEKLEWTRDLDAQVEQLPPGETYEARFDFKGVLQPYTAELTEENRHLFMHGGDQNRIGLTLQDFFRLVRSNNLQQRIAAINAIAGILNIYNKGYYDNVLELPISKIFFLLRFAVDERVPSVIEAATRALSYLFYNETDELLLDATYETTNGITQPILDNKPASLIDTNSDETDTGVHAALENLNLNDTKKPFEVNIKEDLAELSRYDDESGDKNDFHLAEVNLPMLLVKSNIINRIKFILMETKPSEVTVNACMKLLIRIARMSREHAFKILAIPGFVQHLVAHFLPCIEGSMAPYPIVLKLLRVIVSYDRIFMKLIAQSGVLDIVQRYISTKRELDVRTVKILIESFRLMRLYFFAFTDEPRYKQLIDPLKYHMSFCFNQLDFQNDSFAIYRQYASAMLRLMETGNTNTNLSTFSESLKTLLSKWLDSAKRHGAKEYTQRVLLSAALDVNAPLFTVAPSSNYDFVNKYFKPFLQSDFLNDLIERLVDSSVLLDSTFDRCNEHLPLINLGSIVFKSKKSPPTHILSRDYSVPLLRSLSGFIECFDTGIDPENQNYFKDLIELLHAGFQPYLRRLVKGGFNRKISANWFVKPELDLIRHLLDSKYLALSDDLLYVAFGLVSVLTQDFAAGVLEAFDRIIFTPRYYEECKLTQDTLNTYKMVYSAYLLGKMGEKKPHVSIAVVENWNQIMLGEAWPYALLLLLLYKRDVGCEEQLTVDTTLKDMDIVLVSLNFTLLIEKNNVKTVSQSQKLMYLMLVYFAEDGCYFHDDVKNLIKEKQRMMKYWKFPPHFNFKLNNKKSFESLYKMFLTIFEAESYNDNLFSVLVMVPLKGSYDVKWRKLIWSEHYGSIRCINCKENELIGKTDEYLKPATTDQSLLRCYKATYDRNDLKGYSIPLKAAIYNLRKHKIIEGDVK